MRNYSAGLTEGNWVSCTYVSEVVKKRGKAGKRLVEEMPPVSDSSDLMNLALKLPCDGYQSRPIDISLKKGVKATQQPATACCQNVILSCVPCSCEEKQSFRTTLY